MIVTQTTRAVEDFSHASLAFTSGPFQRPSWRAVILLAVGISDTWRFFILATAKILHVLYGIHHQYAGFDVSGQAQLTLSHLRYGQHLTKGQVNALSAPHPDSTGLVEDWLSHHDLLHDPESQLTRSFSRGWVSLSVSVGRLEQI